MLHTKFKLSDVQQWCVETLQYKGQHKLAEEMKEWTMPRLPVTGNDLKEHVTQSTYLIVYYTYNNETGSCLKLLSSLLAAKKMALVVRKLKDYWADNDYKPGTEELISIVPKILEEINDGQLVKNKKV